MIQHKEAEYEVDENCGARFEITPIPGVYRIVLELRFVGGELLDGKDRVSNRFWLGLPSVSSQLPPRQPRLDLTP